MTALVIVEAVAIGLLAVLVAGLLRSHAEILRALHSLGVGEDEIVGPDPHARTSPHPPARPASRAPARDVVGETPDGAAVHVGVVGTSHSTLLAFLSSGCPGCERFWEGLAPGELDLPGRDTRVVVVTKGPDSESPAAVAALAPDGVRTVMSTQAFADYEVPATPYFVMVDGPAGSVAGEGSAATWRQLAALAGRAADDAAHAARRRRHRARLRDTDAELVAAGIEPGDPSLYPGGSPGGSGS